MHSASTRGLPFGQMQTIAIVPAIWIRVLKSIILLHFGILRNILPVELGFQLLLS
jgi:hypothetical protein